MTAVGLHCLGFCFGCLCDAPIRYQYVPAVILSIAAPILILLIGIQVSAWIAIAAIVASILMFRNPLRYLWAKIRGQNLQRPPEFSE